MSTGYFAGLDLVTAMTVHPNLEETHSTIWVLGFFKSSCPATAPVCNSYTYCLTPEPKWFATDSAGELVLSAPVRVLLVVRSTKGADLVGSEFLGGHHAHIIGAGWWRCQPVLQDSPGPILAQGPPIPGPRSRIETPSGSYRSGHGLIVSPRWPTCQPVVLRTMPQLPSERFQHPTVGVECS
jgi:hypothetical protein